MISTSGTVGLAERIIVDTCHLFVVHQKVVHLAKPPGLQLRQHLPRHALLPRQRMRGRLKHVKPGLNGRHGTVLTVGPGAGRFGPATAATLALFVLVGQIVGHGLGNHVHVFGHLQEAAVIFGTGVANVREVQESLSQYQT